MNIQLHPIIVVGVDGSADSDRALDWAAGAAVARDAGLHLVHALPHLANEVPYWHAAEQRHLDHAARVLDEARSRVRTRVRSLTTQTVNSGAGPTLVTAGSHALMVVLGARGHGRVSGLVLGSVSQHVPRHATCPVVVVREAGAREGRRVVVGVDGGPSNERAIEFAFAHASRTDAPLVAIRAWRDRGARPRVGPGYWTRPDIGERIDAEKRLLGEALAGWAEKYPDVRVTREAIPVDAAQVLTDASERAALVVVGSRGRGALAGVLLGSVSQAVLHHARRPVAVVH